MKYTNEKIEDLLKEAILINLYHHPSLREKKEEIANTYKYFYNSEIESSQDLPPLMVVGQSPMLQVSYELVQSLGLDFYTNPDLKTKAIEDILIHTVDMSHPSAAQKINNLSQLEGAALVNFSHIDKAQPEASGVLKRLIKNKNIFFAAEATTLSSYPDIFFVAEIDNQPRPKLK